MAMSARLRMPLAEPVQPSSSARTSASVSVSGGNRRLGLVRAVGDFRRLETGSVGVAMGCRLLPSRFGRTVHPYLGSDQAIKASRLRVPVKAIDPSRSIRTEFELFHVVS